jgi:anaerobic magnesium-protoporphyrin IX monomethyl ester cyclase
MKILALNPPFFPKYSRESRSPAVTKSGTLYYPMWLAYAVGYLEKQGHEVLFIDAPAAELSADEVVARAERFGPSLAILDSSTPSIYNDVEVAANLKKRIPGLFTALVGVHVSAVPRETLEMDSALDAAAFGEYDATMADLAATLASAGRNDDALKKVAGLAFRMSNSEIAVNPRRPYIQDLDDIPMVSEVYKKHLDIAPYFYGHSRYPLVVLVTGRGCPFRCTYCVIPQTLHGHAYRKRSVESVVREFRYIKENFPNAKEIMIEDDTLTADHPRCRELSQRLIDERLTSIPWSANSRADVDYETMRLMKKAGCRLFCVGVESGEQAILDNIQKSMTIDKIRTFRREARRAGILVHGCFMVGNRGETRETLEKTLTFALELNPDTAQFFPIMVYPGTADFDYFTKKGWVTTTDYRKWITAEGLHSSVVSNPDLTYEMLVDFCDAARRKFYLRPSYLFSKALQALTSPGEAPRLLKGFVNIRRYLFASRRRGANDCKRCA